MNVLRNEPQRIGTLIKKKDPTYDVELLLSYDSHLRTIRADVETLRQKRNELAQQGKSGVTDALREQSIVLGRQLKEKEKELQEHELLFKNQLLACPNIPLDDVPVGDKDANKVVRVVGEKPHFAWEPKNHMELGAALAWFDFDIGAKLAASNFAFYKKDAVNLMYTLGMFMLKNNLKYGFEPVLPPLLVNEQSLQVSGNFPKFKDEVYSVPEDALYLIPTAEVGLANVYRDTILSAEQLPIRMTALTSCFRREAGGYGAHERGLIRMHQFEKVELVSLCEPEKSEEELDRMVACAEDILKSLGLHYRVSLLAGQDTSFQSAKTYDIEVWLPGQKEYREVSSASTCTDFQARRGQIRYKKDQSSKTQLVHTLNASSLALPRLMVALMETYQQEDGSILLPTALSQGMF